jgi:hypothetical protein
MLPFGTGELRQQPKAERPWECLLQVREDGEAKFMRVIGRLFVGKTGPHRRLLCSP